MVSQEVLTALRWRWVLFNHSEAAHAAITTIATGSDGFHDPIVVRMAYILLVPEAEVRVRTSEPAMYEVNNITRLRCGMVSPRATVGSGGGCRFDTRYGSSRPSTHHHLLECDSGTEVREPRRCSTLTLHGSHRQVRQRPRVEIRLGLGTG